MEFSSKQFSAERQDTQKKEEKREREEMWVRRKQKSENKFH